MPSITDISVAIYKTLLALYPRDFRREFASDMIHDFEDASHSAWTKDRWRGVMLLWLFTVADVLRNIPLQWVRSGTLIITAVALGFVTFCAAVVSMLDLRVPYTSRPGSPERDGVLLLVLGTTIVVVITATIVFSLMFLRSAFTRHAGRRRV